MERFGVLFGRLVRAKRGIEGLSQDDLATKTELTKARISGIETGKTPNPQAKTVDALCVALNISREERAACYASTAPSLPPHLLENVALRFGHNNPNAREEDLGVFLADKAKEFREMRERLAEMAVAEARIADLLAATNGALERGDFPSADSFLEEAESVQLSSTIAVVEKQAKLRLERGNAALISGDVTTGCNHFERSARYFSGIDSTIEASHRDNYCSILRHYAYRYRSHEALHAARSALERNLHIWSKDTNAECLSENILNPVSRL
jgi:transcriptional regulator with XRE-family HTH domain